MTGLPVKLASQIKFLLAKKKITYVIETKDYVVVRIKNEDVIFYGDEFKKLVSNGLIGFGISADSDRIFELYFSRSTIK